MKNNNVLSELIYEYYESRILFGVCRYGDQLKSVPQICDSFGMARNTVQTALKKLEASGYIKTEKRKVARVVYQGTKEMFRDNTARYFVPRRNGILDINLWGHLMFTRIWEKGLKTLELNRTDDTSGEKNKVGIIVSEPTRFYFRVLSTFNNGLMNSLYWQFLRYLNYFYPNSHEEKADYVEEEFLTIEKIGRLKKETDAHYAALARRVLDFAEAIYKQYGLEDIEQIPFKWTIYRHRPQVRYTLASTIIREILWEVYPVDSYLPSLGKMAEQYQVSLITVRRTLDVLRSLGVIKTIQGIGIQVCRESIDINGADRQEIKKNLLLHGEGMELLALTVYDITLFTLESITKDKKEELLQKIRNLYGKNSSILCIDVLLDFISDECPSIFIKECYSKLRELMAWGYISSAILKGTGIQMDIDLTDFLISLETALKTDNFAAFAEQCQSFIENKMHFLRSMISLWDCKKGENSCDSREV